MPKKKHRRPKAAPKIFDAEWEVMKVLWNSDVAQRASEVLDRLSPERQWAQKTVNTFLARLSEKGVISVRRDGRANCYAVAVPREDCVRDALSSFARRVFRGSPGPMLMHFIENESLSKDEIEQLKSMLEKKGS